MKKYFAVDLGATSGRTIVGYMKDGKIEIEEINRFPNKLIHTLGHYYWDIYALFDNIVDGLKIAAEKGYEIDSIGIDTWGCDFVMVGEDGQFLGQPYSYRDPHTDGAPERFFAEKMSKQDMYDLTGIQIMQFNSIFQMETLRNNKSVQLDAASKLLFIPDALSYMLTGKMVCEYSVATTAAIVNAQTRRLEPKILAQVGLTEHNFGRFVYPGERIGELTLDIQKATGLGAIPVIAVAGHDTASAVAAVPAKVKNFAYLSSGTWSLMGIEVDEPIINEKSAEYNFTNEGGINNTIRVLKNICGMWLLERCRLVWNDNLSYPELIALAQKAEPKRSIINPDDPMFANPVNMVEAIKEYCRKTNQPVPEEKGQMVRCIYESLANRYKEILDMLQEISGNKIEALHIIGGGSRNQMLNKLTEEAIGIPVIAGPGEATAIGNIMIQMVASGEASSITELRAML